MKPLVIALALMLTACAVKHISPDPPRVIQTEEWVATEQPPGTITIVATDMHQMELALQQLCQGKEYVCLRPAGADRIMRIARHKR